MLLKKQAKINYKLSINWYDDHFSCWGLKPLKLNFEESKGCPLKGDP